jgi:hypothetical protein
MKAYTINDNSQHSQDNGGLVVTVVVVWWCMFAWGRCSSYATLCTRCCSHFGHPLLLCWMSPSRSLDSRLLTHIHCCSRPLSLFNACPLLPAVVERHTSPAPCSCSLTPVSPSHTQGRNHDGSVVDPAQTRSPCRLQRWSSIFRVLRAMEVSERCLFGTSHPRRRHCAASSGTDDWRTYRPAVLLIWCATFETIQEREFKGGTSPTLHFHIEVCRPESPEQSRPLKCYWAGHPVFEESRVFLEE